MALLVKEGDDSFFLFLCEIEKVNWFIWKCSENEEDAKRVFSSLLVYKTTKIERRKEAERGRL